MDSIDSARCGSGLGRSDATAWVTRLTDGQPVADAAVRFDQVKSSNGRTGTDGTVQLTLPKVSQHHRALIVNTKNDSAFLPANTHPGAAVGDGQGRERRVVTWYSRTDRGLRARRDPPDQRLGSGMG